MVEKKRYFIEQSGPIRERLGNVLQFKDMQQRGKRSFSYRIDLLEDRVQATIFALNADFLQFNKL
jgi:hypothetical protein